MAQKDTLTCTKYVWLQLTNSSATIIRIQPINGFTLEVQAMLTATPPSDVWPNPGSVFINEATVLKLSEIWPDAVYTNIYVRATVNGQVSFSHD